MAYQQYQVRPGVAPKPNGATAITAAVLAMVGGVIYLFEFLSRAVGFARDGFHFDL